MEAWCKRLTLIKCLLVILLLAVTGCDSEASKVKQTSHVIFDIPALIGKNIDEVHKILGKPTDSDPDPPKHKEIGNYSCFYDIDNQTLGISYDPYTRIVKSFQIFSAQEYDNVNALLKLGNLHAMENLDYRVEVNHPIFTRNFRSIIVILK